MSRHFVSILLLAVSTILVGVAVGYYVAMTGSLPISGNVLVIIGLIFGAVLTAFHAGRSAASAPAALARVERSWDAFRRELDRSRRFERPFTLLRLAPAQALDEPDQDGAAGGGLIGTLRLMVRSIDEVWTMDGSIYVVLPEATRTSATQLVGRLQTIMPEAAELAGVEIAEFPQDGLTMGALLGGLRPIAAPGEALPVRLVPALGDIDLVPDERTG